MTNNIDIVWTSDQRQLMADMQKRQVMIEKDVLGLKKTAEAGKAAGAVLTSSYRDSTKEIERLGRVAETAFKRPVSALDQHLNRMKELRVLFRMGKIDAEQFDRAASVSLKQKYADTGARARLAEMKRAAAEEKATSAKNQADELNRTQAFYAARRKFWEADAAAQEATRQKNAARNLKDQSDERAAQSKFYSERRQFWERDAAAQKEQQKSLGDQVRRSLMSEREIARQNFRERMRQIWDLRKQGAISQQEYAAAAKQALDTWKKASKIDMSGVWSSVPGQIRAALTVTGGVLASLKLIRSELDNLQTKQKESANTTMTYAEAQSEAVQNLDDSMTPAELDKSVMDLAKKKGISPAFVMRAASNVLGARGAVSAKDAMGAIGTSIDFNPFNQGAANFTASAILQAKAARPDASYEALLGQQKSAKIASPVVSDQDFAHYLVPGASGAAAFKDSERDFYSLAAHLGARMGDTSGRVTGTATIDLQRDLATHPFLKDVKAGDEGATMAKLRAIAFDKKYAAVKGTLLGEINAKSQDELVKSGGKLTTEARAYGAIALLLQGDKESWKQLEQKRGEVLEPGKQAEALVDLQRKGLAGLPAQQTARAQKGMEAEGEILDLENQGAARGAVSREALQNLLRKAGVPKVEQVMSGIRFEVGSNGGEEVPTATAEQIIRNYSKSKASPYIDQGGFNAYGPDALMKRLGELIFGSERRKREATPEELKASESLLRAANALEALAKLPPPNFQVNVPGENKPAPVPAAGLQGGRF